MSRLNTYTTSTLLAADDYLVTDGATNGTRKMLGSTLVGVTTLDSGAAANLALKYNGTAGITLGASSAVTFAGAFTGTIGTLTRTGADGTLTTTRTSGASGTFGSGTSNTYLGSDSAHPLVLYTGGTTALTLDTSQNATFAGVQIQSTDTRSGPGAVSVTKDTTLVTSTGVGDALTLANGTAGQIKHIIHDVDGGSAVLTPTTKTGYSTITFTNAGDAVTLEYVATRGWIVVGSFGVTIA